MILSGVMFDELTSQLYTSNRSCLKSLQTSAPATRRFRADLPRDLRHDLLYRRCPDQRFPPRNSGQIQGDSCSTGLAET